ncbi:DinB family protein [Actinopolymorpha rutila]|uniref:DinB-like domain-containing protein n=1 Tax=Actinopolymorpha rutila TaxID=446787 RepID=A0A852ZL61_9ACTN|nr:DinB family protein [Actinopolymorpha rutila]NYH92855.1 hypothetical protein [Actinopolymorpha rutila]
MATNRGVAWPNTLLDQLDFFWARQARPRLEGLSDEEYFWEPVHDCWSLRPGPTATGRLGGLTMDLERDSESVPDPVTTIAWRLAHVTVHILKARTYSVFDDPDSDPGGHSFAGTAAVALGQLDDAYLRWKAGFAGLTDGRLAEPIGPEERYFEGQPMATLILHVNREVLSHIAEIALLRDLYARHASA